MNWMSKHQRIGWLAEQWAKEQLEKRGYEVQYVADWHAVSSDLIVNGSLVIEVKQSNQRVRRYVSKKTGEVREYPWFQVDTTNLDTSDRVVMFIARDNWGVRHPFIIPGAVAGTRSSLAVSSHPLKYQGYLSPFLNNWNVIDFILKKVYRNEDRLVLAEYQGIREHA